MSTILPRRGRCKRCARCDWLRYVSVLALLSVHAGWDYKYEDDYYHQCDDYDEENDKMQLTLLCPRPPCPAGCYDDDDEEEDYDEKDWEHW